MVVPARVAVAMMLQGVSNERIDVSGLYSIQRLFSSDGSSGSRHSSSGFMYPSGWASPVGDFECPLFAHDGHPCSRL